MIQRLITYVTTFLGEDLRDSMRQQLLTWGVYLPQESRFSSGTFVIRMQTAIDKTMAGMKEVQNVLSDCSDQCVTSLEVKIPPNFIMKHSCSLI